MRLGGQLIQKMQFAWKRKSINAERSSQVGLQILLAKLKCDFVCPEMTAGYNSSCPEQTYHCKQIRMTDLFDKGIIFGMLTENDYFNSINVSLAPSERTDVGKSNQVWSRPLFLCLQILL